jgi:site-specific DNA-methyltransferase (adenine-specific)
VDLAKDHIKGWSNPSDIVYDCFMGSGTTAKMALLAKRDFIGSEVSPLYCNLANKSLKKYTMQFSKEINN